MKASNLRMIRAQANCTDLCKLDTDAAAKPNQTVADLAAVGMPALGVAESVNDGKSWSFLVILSMLDPPRDDSKQTIEQAKAHGLRVKMVTGDGVNDTPALKQADCGVAVSGATDAGRAAAALILTAPGLSTIIEAIDEARMIFERIINYSLSRVAMTLDIMFVVVMATVFPTSRHRR
jgi:magnesium-transporting ATPase (P-type)